MQQAPVIADHRGPVFLGANGAASPLQQANTGRRHHQLSKGITPKRFQPLGPSLFHRVSWGTERQLGDKHGFAQSPWKVQAFTKRLQAKNNGGLTGFDTGLMCRQQAAAGQLALNQNAGQQGRIQRIDRRPHLQPGGKKRQRAMADLSQVLHQLSHHGTGVGGGVARVGGRFHHHQPALGLVIEGAGHRQRCDLSLTIQAGLLQKIIKAPAAGQGG